MTTLTPDMPALAAPPSRLAAGFGFALVSASAFGLSGALARGLLDAGWTAGAAVTARVALAAAVLLVPALLALRGRWGLLVGNPRNLGTVTLYGVLAVAGAQLCYFYAVSYLQVGVALLIEYTAPVAVVVWLWLRHGQRPGRVTVLGAVIAAVGLALVLEVVTGVSLNVVGVLWGLGAMVGAATYFVISADGDNGLPGTVLAGGGLLVGAVALGTAGLVGVLPMRANTLDVAYGDLVVAWWVPVVGLGLVTAALAYVTGIAAGRRLGSRLASFVALFEVVMALVFAWLLLGELPRPVQLAGGLLILVGVIVVKLGERDVRAVRVGDPETAEVADAA
ncbi:EamA family transporter [Nocardioides alkalitolerans]|uniref:EamA family transporter n=1 Tax=Nocardioides alkalitolerans TaxID=281714 RepID=UPI00048BDABE|nr:EamA family transporter [Nocardioides alkalitolerans]